MGGRRAQGFLLLRLFRGLRQANKLRALLHPLQPLQDTQLSKGAQPFVAHVVAAFIAQGVAFGGGHGWMGGPTTLASGAADVQCRPNQWGDPHFA